MSDKMKQWKEIKTLPKYLQPKILSAVAFIHSCSSDKSKGTERLERISKHLSDQEMVWVVSLLAFEHLIENLKTSNEFQDFEQQMVGRTLQ